MTSNLVKWSVKFEQKPKNKKKHNKLLKYSNRKAQLGSKEFNNKANRIQPDNIKHRIGCTKDEIRSVTSWKTSCRTIEETSTKKKN